MSLTWLRHHVRHRDRNAPRSHRFSNQRFEAAAATTMRPHRTHTKAKALAPCHITYDSSFVADRSVTSRDANWTSDEQLKRQCLRLGWHVVATRKDGNCLFRALSDQLYGHERRHLELRRRLVDFIDLERTCFEPFLERSDDIVAYCSRLRQAGAWGGHPELVAASKLLGVTIVVHTGPVKRLRVCDAMETAKPKEGQGKTVNLLLMHDHYSSLRKDGKPNGEGQQLGCSETCLCRRLFAPSSDVRASLGAYQGHWCSDVSSARSSLGGTRPGEVTAEKRGRTLRESKGAYGRKSVPAADLRTAFCDEDSPVHKKLQTSAVVKPNVPPPPPPPVEVGTTEVAVVTDGASMRSLRSTTSARPKAPAAPPVTGKLEVARSKPSSTSAGNSKNPGVVLFEPEALGPLTKPQVPLVVLFDPDQASDQGLTTSKKSTTAANAGPVVKPTSVKIVQVDGSGPEPILENRKKAAPQRSVHRPCRAVFEGGRRRRSGSSARVSMQEVSTSLSDAAVSEVKPVTVKLAKTMVTAEVTAVKLLETVQPVASPVAADEPQAPAPRPMEIKRSSKKVFCRGRLVAAG
uniref:OTU domain-containing protein 1 n=1 Tax=Peronospora matthiolae TaxID=2874970 RepID=A0AAV1TW42_9STRA